ncbi:MAG: TolC family protein [Leptospiraceae bacterium]|nr:TolC family protein [Leptospiraceae bacterium]
MRIISILALLLAQICLNAQEKWTLQRCIDYAYQNNIQLKQAELNVDLSEADRLQSRGNALPNLNGQASHGYNWGQTIDPFTNSFATSRIRSNNIGLNTSVTLFNGFQNINSIKRSDLNLAVSEQNLDQAKNDLALNVANAFLNVLFNEEFLNIAQSNLESSTQQVDRISKLVDAGASPRGALYDIEAQMATDEASVINAENNLRLAYLSLTQILQLSPEEASGFEVASPDLDEFSSSTLVSDPEMVVQSALNNFPSVKSAEINVLSAEKSLSIAKGTISPRLSASFS